MPNRIDETFATLRKANRAAFITYITAGDPSLAATETLVPALQQAGADIIELGVPFSDPLADGVVNQMAAQRALEAGTTLAGIFATIRRIRSASQVPLVLFTYLNPLYVHGFDRFHAEAAEAGVDGILILDLPPEEIEANAELADRHRLKSIRLIAPTTPPARMARIVRNAGGFIYYVSREGVTGEQAELSTSIAGQVREIKQHTDLPVAVGFGISTPGQAAAVAAQAEGVVVGSAIVRRIAEQAGHPDLAGEIREFVRPLAEAAHHASRPSPAARRGESS
jgi:tryptophan synthase alpha chain